MLLCLCLIPKYKKLWKIITLTIILIIAFVLIFTCYLLNNLVISVRLYDENSFKDYSNVYIELNIVNRTGININLNELKYKTYIFDNGRKIKCSNLETFNILPKQIFKPLSLKKNKNYTINLRCKFVNKELVDLKNKKIHGTIYLCFKKYIFTFMNSFELEDTRN